MGRKRPMAEQRKQRALSLCSQENNMKQDEELELDLFCFGAFQGARHAVVLDWEERDNCAEENPFPCDLGLAHYWITKTPRGLNCVNI